jgi:hypothetical protein
VICDSAADCDDCDAATQDRCFNGTCWHLLIAEATPGDIDGDGDLDLDDFAIFQLCFTGPGGDATPYEIQCVVTPSKTGTAGGATSLLFTLILSQP